MPHNIGYYTAFTSLFTERHDKLVMIAMTVGENHENISAYHLFISKKKDVLVL